ncbi:MAG: protein kinase domain-containing protein [Deltaproteobacteria bacterium]
MGSDLRRGVGLLLAGLALIAATAPGLFGPEPLLGDLADGASPIGLGLRWLARGLALGGLFFLSAAALRRARDASPREAPAPAPSPSRRVAAGPVSPSAEVLAREAERKGDYARAGALFDGLSDWRTAARCYGKAARVAPAGTPARAAAVQLFALRSFAAGDDVEAIALLTELGEWLAAAELEGKRGNRLGEAELLARGGRLDEAVAQLEGDAPKDAAALCERHGQKARAAELWERAGQDERAAELWLALGERPRAVAAFRRLHDPALGAERLLAEGAIAEAGELWIEAGETRKALEVFRKLGDPAAAAPLLERAGEGFEAARLYLSSGNAEAALQSLERLAPDLRQSVSVRLLAGAAQLKAGRPAEAAATVQALLARGVGQPKLRCEALYLLGLSLLPLKDAGQALACFEQVVAIDPSFRDAGLRLAQLRASGPSGTNGTVFSGRPASPAAPASPSGQLPARYRIEQKLGEGSMGVVYRAQDTVLERPVAVKLLSSALAQNERARGYFLREARVAAALSHPNIVTVYDAGFEGETLYLVMEFLKGQDLEALAERNPTGLPERQALAYAAQVADALAAVHERQVVHRDVKPSNIVRLEGREQVKLMDFGVAHLGAGGEAGPRRKATLIAGTPDFMPPEQLAGGELGPATDLYALGGTLYELLTGQVPFPTPDPTARVGAPPDPRALRPDISERTSQLVRHCLAPRPEDRPQRADELRDALRA